MKTWNLFKRWRSKSYGDLRVWMSPLQGDETLHRRSWLQELDRMAVTTTSSFERTEATEPNQ